MLAHPRGKWTPLKAILLVYLHGVNFLTSHTHTVPPASGHEYQQPPQGVVTLFIASMYSSCKHMQFTLWWFDLHKLPNFYGNYMIQLFHNIFNFV